MHEINPKHKGICIYFWFSISLASQLPDNKIKMLLIFIFSFSLLFLTLVTRDEPMYRPIISNKSNYLYYRPSIKTANDQG